MARSSSLQNLRFSLQESVQQSSCECFFKEDSGKLAKEGARGGEEKKKPEKGKGQGLSELEQQNERGGDNVTCFNEVGGGSDQTMINWRCLLSSNCSVEMGLDLIKSLSEMGEKQSIVVNVGRQSIVVNVDISIWD